MSWLARSFVNTLRGEDEEQEEDENNDNDINKSNSPSNSSAIEHGGVVVGVNDEDQQQSSRSGVKEDISELTKTLSRQFWGVANFLAPPPTSDNRSPPASESPIEESSPIGTPRLAGIRNDFAEIGGKVRSGISMLSSKKAVSEISKIASTLFAPEREDEDEEEFEVDKSGSVAIGVTEEVLAFARNISMHPETWLDFPLLPDEDETDDFDMSDAQQEHALAVERLAPRLAALRIELCPSHMSEACFWKIYFVLLHPRLNQNDAELLSTPQIVEARAKLQGLQSRSKQGLDRPEVGSNYKKEILMPVQSEEHLTTIKNKSNEAASPKGAAEETITVPIADVETEKHPVSTTEVKIVDKSVTEEEPSMFSTNRESSDDALKIPIDKFEDEWLEDEDTGEVGGSHITLVQIGNDDDVSFSDLEEDDDEGAPKSTKAVDTTTASQRKESKERKQSYKGSKSVKGGKPSGAKVNESNDWSDFDDIDEIE